jgi:putative transposase
MEIYHTLTKLANVVKVCYNATMKTFKYRIYPNKETSLLLNAWFGQTRFVWNYYLNQRTVAYKETGKGLSYNANAKDLTQLKKQDEYSWLKECPSQALQQQLKVLDSAFKDFFSRGKGYPRFKKRGFSNDTLHFPAGFKVDGKYLTIPKCKKPIKMKLSREIKGSIRSIKITKNKANQYFVSILTDYEPTPMPKIEKEIGIDVGLKDFVVTSDGLKIKMPHFIDKGYSKLKKLQRRLSKKQKGSANREKARLKVAKHQLHIANQRKDFLHKVSTKLINENQVIAIESLTVKGMIRNRKLSKSIANASWGEFSILLSYKATWYGRTIKTLDKFFPSSKMCNTCGYIKEDLKLSDRTITCKGCGTTYDRDINASKNILQFSAVG